MVFFGENIKTLAWIVAEGRFLECAVASEVGRGNNKRHLFRILLEVSVPQVPHRRGANFRFELGGAVPAQKRFAVTFWLKFSRGVKHCQKLCCGSRSGGSIFNWLSGSKTRKFLITDPDTYYLSKIWRSFWNKVQHFLCLWFRNSLATYYFIMGHKNVQVGSGSGRIQNYLTT
jgi:hypothetical protein